MNASDAHKRTAAARRTAAAHACGGCCTRLLNFGVTLGDAVILRDVNIHVHCGELTALVGPNGAGKTTLFRAMLGELPHAGELRFVHAGDGARFVSPRIGYVPQKLDLDRTAPVSVLDLFAAATTRWPVWLSTRRAARADALAALDRVNAAGLAGHRLGQLSCGELQRVLLALALHPVPDLLLLDEPIAGVDRAGTALFYRTVSQLRRDYDLSILLIAHDLAEVARHADRMILLNRAILADGPPADVLAAPVTRELFGIDFSPAATVPPAGAHCPAAAAPAEVES
jgi:zinc transport system ATP-binding protein